MRSANTRDTFQVDEVRHAQKCHCHACARRHVVSGARSKPPDALLELDAVHYLRILPGACGHHELWFPSMQERQGRHRRSRRARLRISGVETGTYDAKFTDVTAMMMTGRAERSPAARSRYAIIANKGNRSAQAAIAPTVRSTMWASLQAQQRPRPADRPRASCSIGASGAALGSGELARIGRPVTDGIQHDPAAARARRRIRDGLVSDNLMPACPALPHPGAAARSTAPHMSECTRIVSNRLSRT
jgi:hypothetical protein